MKTLRKFLCLLLALMMLLSCATPIFAEVDEDDSGLVEDPEEGGEGVTDITNLWVDGQPGYFDYDDINAVTTQNAEPRMYTSGTIEVDVKVGDTITFGPYWADLRTGDNPYIGVGYYANGSYAGTSQIYTNPSTRDTSLLNCVEEETIFGDLKIYTYTVDKAVKSIRLLTVNGLQDYMVVTKNHRFTAAEYFKYMDDNNINVDFLRPTDHEGEYNNLFATSNENARVGYRAADGTWVEDAAYTSIVYDVGTTGAEALAPGDILYMIGSTDPSFQQLSVTYTNDYIRLMQPKMAELRLLSDAPFGAYNVCEFMVTSSVKDVCLVFPTAKYEAGEVLVTKNQPFTDASYREAFDVEVENLYKKDEVKENYFVQSSLTAQSESQFWYTSNTIEVTGGDIITVAPSFTYEYSVNYYGLAYKSNGKYLRPRLGAADGTTIEVEPIYNNAKIYTYIVPEGATHFHLSFIPQFVDCMMITKNCVFTAEEYFAYMEEKGVDLSFFQTTTTPSDEITNIFSENVIVGGRPNSGDDLADTDPTPITEAAHYSYRLLNVGTDVQVGDTVYFTAPINIEGYVAIVRYQNNGFTKLNATNMICHDDIGNGSYVYAYKVPSNVKEVGILLSTDNYQEGRLLATINQPFTAEEALEKWGYTISEEIAVQEGDTITVGALASSSNWFIRPYTKDATTDEKIYGEKVNASSLYVTSETILDTVRIYTYTVPKGVTRLHVVYNEFVDGCVLIKKNDVFTKADWFAAMEEANVDVGYLEYKDTEGELTNLFPYDDSLILRGKVSKGVFEENLYVRSRKLEVGEGKDVKAGDVLYFGAAYQKQSLLLSVVYNDGSAVDIAPSEILMYEDIGREYGIYVYPVPENATEIYVVLATGDYDRGITLLTKNQPFTGEHYRELFDIDLNEDILDENSPLNGLKGLFIGDSISRGGHDYISYLDHTRTGSQRIAWAGGIAATTGLDAVNPSYSGGHIVPRASCSGCDKDGKHWIYNQMVPYFETGSEFDVVVMHGGVNDCPVGRSDLGTPLSVDASEADLEAALTVTGANGKTTYAAGLQWIIYNAKKNFTNAEFFFVANFQILSSGRNEPLKAYLDVAKEICEMYGVHYIDLYNNDEVTERMETTTLKNMDDELHPNGPGYDVITPYIRRELEAVMCDEETHQFTVDGKDDTHHYKECRYCGVIEETTKVAHIYENNCDTTCDEATCGYIRTVGDHVYTNACDADCNECGAGRTPAAHEYDNACDVDCNECGATRTPADHVYDNACDADCNECGATRTPADHVYANNCDADCNECGATRTPADHVYDNNCDADCNECGAGRTPADHVYDNNCDTECNECGAVREVDPHDYSVFDYNEDGHWKKCAVCGVIDEETRVGHSFSDDNDTDCECGYVRNVCDHADTEFDHSETEHWKKCSACGTIDESTRAEHAYTVSNYDETHHYNECVCGLIDESTKTEHDFVVPKKDNNQHWTECACGAIEGEKADHDYAVTKNDDYQHWGECACGATSAKENHSYTATGKNAVEHWNLCVVCEKTDPSSKAAHVFGEWVVMGDVRTRSCACGFVESEEYTPVVPDSTTAEGNDDATTEPEGDVTTDPEDVTTVPETESETNPVTEPTDNVTEEAEKDGCGSVVGGTAALVALVLILPAAVAVKKKEDEE